MKPKPYQTLVDLDPQACGQYIQVGDYNILGDAVVRARMLARAGVHSVLVMRERGDCQYDNDWTMHYHAAHDPTNAKGYRAVHDVDAQGETTAL